MTEHTDKIKAALEAIRKKNGGRLTRQQVVDAARAKNHPLHDEFVWDDRKAADLQRLDRAQELIVRYLTVVIVDRSVKITAPFYVRDPSAEANEPGYVALTSEQIDRNAASQIILNEVDRCESAIGRARDIAGVLERKHHGIVGMLESMLANLIDIRKRLQAAE